MFAALPSNCLSGPISCHGGHSGQFCCHARDNLEQIIQAYVQKGFRAVGITEHIPPLSDKFRYPDEAELGLTSADLHLRFDAYFTELARLQKEYAGTIRIFRGMETETYTGYQDHVRQLIRRFRPDYIVGSVHHVKDVCFDFSEQEYHALARDLGGMDELYKAYFDLQHEMIQTLRPFVVGHFDLIRIHDHDFEKRLKKPGIAARIDRNLALVKSLGLVLDLNLRPLAKGKKRPYLVPVILDKARQLGIPCVPGDDSHSKSQAGLNVDRAVALLEQAGFPTRWPEPVLVTPKGENE